MNSLGTTCKELAAAAGIVPLTAGPGLVPRPYTYCSVTVWCYTLCSVTAGCYILYSVVRGRAREAKYPSTVEV